MTPQLLKILELAAKKEAVTPSDLVRAFSGKKKPNTQEATEMLRHLAELNLGVIESSGRSIKFKIKIDILGENRSKIDAKIDKRLHSTSADKSRVVEDREPQNRQIDPNSPLFEKNPDLPTNSQSTEKGSILSILDETESQTLTSQQTSESTLGSILPANLSTLSISEQEQKEAEENALAVGIAELLVQEMNKNTLTKKDVDKVMKDDYEDEGFTTSKPLSDSVKTKIWRNLTPYQRKKLKQIMGK